MSDNSKIAIIIQEGHRNAGLTGDAGIFAKVGAGRNGAVGDPDTPYKITSDDAAATLFGFGSPLHKSAKLHFGLGGAPLWAVMPTNDIVGSCSDIVASGDGDASTKVGTGNLVLNDAGSTPVNDANVIIQILSAGGTGMATFRYSINAGGSWSSVYTLSGAQISLSDIGILIDVIEGDPASGSFARNDQYTFSTTAPTYSLNNLGTALNSLTGNDYIRMVHALGAVDTPFLSDFDYFISQMQSSKRWLRGLASLRKRDKEESTTNYINYLVDTGRSFYSTRLALCYQHVLSGILGEEIYAANYLLATLSKAKIQESPGWVGAFPQNDILSIADWDTLESVHSMLEGEGLNSVYYEDGKAAGKAPFWGIGLLKSPSTSDYRKISSGRVMDEACLGVHGAVITSLRATQNRKTAVAGNQAGLLGMKGKMESVFERMLAMQQIEAYEINIPLIDSGASLAEIASAILGGNVEGTFKLEANDHIENINLGAMYALGI
ncbi:MAG: hypothetical protein GY754_11240 [bacterium]|nr:hypothetical protein [bacterium]